MAEGQVLGDRYRIRRKGGTELSFSKAGEWLSSLNFATSAVRLWRKDGSARQIAESGSPGNLVTGEFVPPLPDGRVRRLRHSPPRACARPAA